MASPSIRDVSEQFSCITRRIGFAARVLDHGIYKPFGVGEDRRQPLLSLPGHAAG